MKTLAEKFQRSSRKTIRRMDKKGLEKLRKAERFSQGSKSLILKTYFPAKST